MATRATLKVPSGGYYHMIECGYRDFGLDDYNLRSALRDADLVGLGRDSMNDVTIDYGITNEWIATFADEETYAACLPALEKYAEKNFVVKLWRA